MKKRILFVTLLALVVLIAIAAPASATKPTEVNGNAWVALEQPDGWPKVEMRPAGNNCIGDVDIMWAFDGDLIGTAPVHLRVVSHGPCPAYPFQNKENIKASGTFTGTVDDKLGTFDFTYEGKAWPAGPGELAQSTSLVILSGTGKLANLHGQLGFSYIMGDDADTYSGQIHFNP